MCFFRRVTTSPPPTEHFFEMVVRNAALRKRLQALRSSLVRSLAEMRPASEDEARSAAATLELARLVEKLLGVMRDGLPEHRSECRPRRD